MRSGSSIAAIAVYLIAYRYYSLFIADRVMRLDPTRPTPAVRHNDGLDYVPTNRYVLFGHHFAAIAGAGPLVGPVLAAQMGYLPGMLWILAGVVLAGAVQDFMVLFVSMRRDGRSLGELIRAELGPVPGVIALFGTLPDHGHHPGRAGADRRQGAGRQPVGHLHGRRDHPDRDLRWASTCAYIRPGAIGEVSVIGFVLLMLAIVDGQRVAEDAGLGGLLHLHRHAALLAADRLRLRRLDPAGLAAARAARLPFDLPQDRHDRRACARHPGRAPSLQMPAVTQFVDGTGPVWSGALFPFLFITIACGAVSGFHALISSGTTPKLIDTEADARFIGYGGMLMESFVAIMALVSASFIEPGVYFTMNSPGAVIGATADSAAAAVTDMGFPVTRGSRSPRPPRTSARRRSSRAPAAHRRSPSAWRRSSPARSAARR